MASALAKAGVAGRMAPYLSRLADQIREALGGPSGGRGRAARLLCPEALECVGTLAVALRGDWQPYAAGLLEPMCQTGLSGGLGACGWGGQASVWPEGRSAACRRLLESLMEAPSRPPLALPLSSACPALMHPSLLLPPRPPAEPLVRSLQLTVGALPELLPRTQELLLDLLSLVLARRPFSCAAPPSTVQALQAGLASGGWLPGRQALGVDCEPAGARLTLGGTS